MNPPDSRRLQFTPELNICRILNGMWQVSGAHGAIAPQRAIQSMFDYFDAGFTTWDLADHYGPAEDFIGEFRRQISATRGLTVLPSLQAFTKWVPRPERMTRSLVEENIDISLRRMDVPSLDLLQFHWWKYCNKNYLDALKYLTELQNEGKIKRLALTNFDTEHLQTVLENDIPIVSNQVQFSLIDRRPLVRMVPFCQKQHVKLLAYGTVCGGLLSERYLGQPEPERSALDTASLRKYKNMIDVWGGWELFQSLLSALQLIAQKHGVSIANIAVRCVLDQPTVAGVIVGARLGVSDHLQDNARVFDLTLDEGDRSQIDAVLRQSRDLYQLIGDCGDEYRR
jgi:aryl-alcohol dehydrogenase-like predicted oxidoreductase